MKTVTIILRDFSGCTKGDVIGVDYGALVCVNKGIPVDLAIGDFDSVSEEEYTLIEHHATKTIRLKPEKDDTDFMAAYRLCDNYDEILVYGALGGRIDHELMHIHTAKRDSRIILMDNKNKIQRLDSGSHIISKDSFKYISFFALTPCHVSLKGFKYSLNHQPVTPDTTYMTSNEIILDQGEIIIDKGSLLMIQSNP